MKNKIKYGDEVLVISGKNKGKSGKVLKLFTNKQRLIVQGINIIKKHKKSINNKGLIIECEGTIHYSNVSLLKST